MSLGAVSVPGEGARTKAVSYLVSGNWLIEEAAKEHLKIPPGGPRLWIEQRYGATSRKPQELERDLAAKGLTMSDLEFQARIALSAAALRGAVASGVHTGSQAEIEAFYEHHRELFSHEQRAVELIETLRSKPYALALAKKLGTGAKFVKRAMKEHVYEPNNGDNDYNAGLLRAIFGAQVGRMTGPVPYLGKWVILIVRQVFHEPSPLAEVSSEVAERLLAARRQQAIEAFAAKYRREWSTKTSCPSEFVAPGCSNSPAKLDSAVNPLTG